MYNPFKKKKPTPEFNLSHPDIRHQVEEAFKAGGRIYYRFKEERLIPAGRHKYIYAFLKEVDLVMTRETLQNYIKDFKALLNGAGAKKTIQLTELMKLVLNLESRVALGMDPEIVERLAAVVYFDENEDLSTYDRKYGNEKISHWKKHNVHDFFLTKPMGELLGLKGISIESLQVSIAQATEMIKNLTEDQQKASLENLSENGSQHS